MSLDKLMRLCNPRPYQDVEHSTIIPESSLTPFSRMSYKESGSRNSFLLCLMFLRPLPAVALSVARSWAFHPTVPPCPGLLGCFLVSDLRGCSQLGALVN